MFKLLKGLVAHATSTGISIFLKLPQEVAKMLDFAMSNEQAFGASLVVGGILGWGFIWFIDRVKSYPDGCYEAVVSLYDDAFNYQSFVMIERKMKENIKLLRDNKGSFKDTKISEPYDDFMQAITSVWDVKKDYRDEGIDAEWAKDLLKKSYPKLKKALK